MVNSQLMLKYVEITKAQTVSPHTSKNHNADARHRYCESQTSTALRLICKVILTLSKEKANRYQLNTWIVINWSFRRWLRMQKQRKITRHSSVDANPNRQIAPGVPCIFSRFHLTTLKSVGSQHAVHPDTVHVLGLTWECGCRRMIPMECLG